MTEKGETGAGGLRAPVLWRQMRAWVAAVRDERANALVTRFVLTPEEKARLMVDVEMADAVGAALDRLAEYESGRRVAAVSTGRPHPKVRDASTLIGEVPG